jgi:hypothetical protein
MVIRRRKRHVLRNGSSTTQLSEFIIYEIVAVMIDGVDTVASFI